MAHRAYAAGSAFLSNNTVSSSAAPQSASTPARNTRAVAFFARLQEVAAGARIEQQWREFGEGVEGAAQSIDHALRELQFETHTHRGTVAQLAKTTLPVIALDRSGLAVVVGNAQGDHLMIQRAGDDKPDLVKMGDFAREFSGTWVSGILSTEAVVARIDPTSHKFGFAWFWHALSKYKAEMAQVLLATFFVQIFALMTPLAFQVVIDKVLTHRSQATLVVMLIALAGVAVFEMVLSGARQYLFSHTTNRVDVELGARLFAHLMRLPMSFFNSRNSGEIIARVRELESARNFLTGQALTAWLDLLFAVVYLAVMFYYSPLLTFIVLAFLPIFFGASYLVSPLLRKKLEDKFALGAENQSFLAETLGAMETLKGQAVESSWRRLWEKRLARYVTSAFESGHTANWTNLVIQTASKLLTVILLGVGAMQVIDGNLTVGGLIAFNMLSGRVNAPILKLSSLWQEFTQMRVSVKRLAEIMDAQPEAATAGGDRRAPIVGEVTFDNVSFQYHENGPTVLSDVSFRVKAGEIIGVVGISGAGKTTLMRLLQRLYTPQSGRVLVDGIDLASADPHWLRSQVGVVAQDAALFNLTAQENIALGQPSLTFEEVMAVAQLAGAHEFINLLPQGYGTVIGERGCLLSGGQRSRIAIARALATDPRILLLDEATASLDYESEQVIHNNLRQICKGRTVFIAAHRLTTLRMADRILVLENGKLVESGHHTTLIDKPGRYRSLFEASRALEALSKPSPSLNHKAAQALPDAGEFHV
ncbi:MULTISPECIES: peptidase domain-containing ABC transporter [Cupriavidus]|uniref:Cyclolysin secretion/processing ATP-binding protein CyaB n=1 Tax=Cupriavidus oxalaticus TaxID=96344 RepID=A0A4P7LFR1_9BURK|nr:MULTISPECIES: type I secretion system permease/ATPase [Cupriavidus]MBF6992615.1 type I secretion system permease/ATPase [Cupriavidus sp. IK-TO18]QBY54906.1 type I secretion system permease/ATPase [Cupriavidus oxalaticus]